MSGATSPWPVIVRVGEVARFSEAHPMHRRLVADEAARKAMAKAYDLVSLNRLEAELDLSGWFDGVRIDGRWSADIVQTCGVTLEDFPTTLSGEFTVRAVPEGSRHAAPPEPEVEVDLDAEDPPDVLETDTVDIGGYVAEHLALEIDPFPRKPGAVFVAPEPEAEASPFAALLKLKDNKPKA
ncbi:MAG: DUF177 domain-containing protein [Caulobacteraceae bacterium]|nr:DUF177 domain-containing protein [Caulobacteraceae bacterium]